MELESCEAAAGDGEGRGGEGGGAEEGAGAEAGDGEVAPAEIADEEEPALAAFGADAGEEAREGPPAEEVDAAVGDGVAAAGREVVSVEGSLSEELGALARTVDSSAPVDVSAEGADLVDGLVDVSASAAPSFADFAGGSVESPAPGAGFVDSVDGGGLEPRGPRGLAPRPFEPCLDRFPLEPLIRKTSNHTRGSRCRGSSAPRRREEPHAANLSLARGPIVG